MYILTSLWILCSVSLVRAVTVYSQVPLYATATALGPNFTAPASNDQTVLQAPPVPSPAPPTQFSLTLQSSNASVANISIAQSGSFLGFSIEFSVISQVLGLNASFLQVPFLNLMSNVKARAGAVHIRVGGNTQEYATMVDSLPDNLMMEKVNGTEADPTTTPTMVYTPEVLYMLANISSLVNIKWFLGVPFNDSTNLRLQIAEVGEAVLGDNLLGLQVGNEPDLYGTHGVRPANYSPSDYYGEFGVMVAGLTNDSNLDIRPPNNLVAPSVATGDWTPEMVWNTGFLDAYSSNIGFMSVEHYPDDNCYALYGIGSPVTPQEVFPNYLNHTSGQSIVQPYLNTSSIAVQLGKPFMMFETNTASCGGFPGLSDSFGSTLWALDYALQMAYSNFSGALLHVGGQDDYYNPFTPPPTNMSMYYSWTVGAVFYTTLAMAEALGTSGTAQIVDLYANNADIYTPGYAIYENGSPARVALFNYITDPSGASDYAANISISGGSLPNQVLVKYLAAPSVAEKYNISWAGQTFGANMQSDGRLRGNEDVQTVNCDSSSNSCSVTVPAPGFALVFLSPSAIQESNPSTTQTFATTSVTKTVNTMTINPSVLATSNGHSGSTWRLSSTSEGSSGATGFRQYIPSGLSLVAIAVGCIIVARHL